MALPIMPAPITVILSFMSAHLPVRNTVLLFKLLLQKHVSYLVATISLSIFCIINAGASVFMPLGVEVGWNCLEATVAEVHVRNAWMLGAGS